MNSPKRRQGHYYFSKVLGSFALWATLSSGFVPNFRPARSTNRKHYQEHLPVLTVRPLLLQKDRTDSESSSSYESTDAASQGFVSALTSLVNSWSSSSSSSSNSTSDNDISHERDDRPRSIQELRDRIEADYTLRNYLWTGNLDLDCFDPDCIFQDPTLSFRGTKTFQRNTQNLVPLVERWVQNPQSILLDLRTTDDYVETRWNMVGELPSLLWKPKVDVIGQTKFWFQRRQGDDYDYWEVFKYEEKWEIPAYQALLQLVTPAGTFPNTS